jgi:transcriptional regulator with XRE-family HTH domain
MNIKMLGQVVAERRKELQLSQEELAQKCDLSRAYLSLIERGDATNVSTKVLDKLALALGVPIAKLLGQPEQSDLLISPALREFALDEGLSLEIVEKLARIPRRGKEPRNAQEWKKLYAVIKPYLR